MSSLDNIIQRIEKDAAEEKAQILENANNEKDIFIKNKIAEANKEKENIIKRTVKDVKQIKDKAVSNANLKARDRVIQAKQDITEQVLALVEEELGNIDKTKFIDYLKKSLDNMTLKPDVEILVPKHMKKAVENANIGYKISEQTVKNGFAILDGNVLLNNEFTSLLESQKEQLEIEIVQKLFK